jgi:glycosyltransferase involved in cell wall biosynthesis
MREPVKAEGYDVIAIEPQAEGEGAGSRADDVTAEGLNPVTHLAYLRLLRSFARQWANSFDVVLEKGWRLSGSLSAAFRAHGVPGVLVENDVRYWSEPVRDVRTVAKYLVHQAAQGVAGYASRQMPLVIAETDTLKAMLIQQRGLSPDRVQVIGLGVDHHHFRPLDQLGARHELGLRPDACILLYVGGLDRYHDLLPLFSACADTSVPDIELHVVGDGVYRPLYAAAAEQVRFPVVFHGQKPHQAIPTFIAAADLCLAPYQVQAFHHQLVPFSTLKIPEYMACARPVVSVPSGHIRELITHHRTGFLVPNEASAWRSFLDAFPARQRLAAMGQAAAEAVASVSWENTAAQYLEAGYRLLATD